jgi:hypothetical protein
LLHLQQLLITQDLLSKAGGFIGGWDQLILIRCWDEYAHHFEYKPTKQEDTTEFEKLPSNEVRPLVGNCFSLSWGRGLMSHAITLADFSLLAVIKPSVCGRWLNGPLTLAMLVAVIASPCAEVSRIWTTKNLCF